MSEVRLIDTTAIICKIVNTPTVPPKPCYLSKPDYMDGTQDRQKEIVGYIMDAPTVPAVPLEDHERMKRELHSEIKLLKSRLSDMSDKCDTLNALVSIHQRTVSARDNDIRKLRAELEAVKAERKKADMKPFTLNFDTLDPATKETILNSFMKGADK